MASIPKSKKKNIPKNIHEMSKEELQATLKKKKECNAKALSTVEKLCEANVDEKWFLDNLQFINQCHFDDATVERAITKLCGYPLCDQKLDIIPAQQYHISTRYNKVFDISERKNFCSSICYKSAVYVKKQLFTSPLWFRDQEVIPKYTVLRANKSSLGEEIVFYEKIKPEYDDLKEKSYENKNIGNEKNVDEVEQKLENLHLKDSERVEFVKTEVSSEDSTKLSENKPSESSSIKNITPVEKIRENHPLQGSVDPDITFESLNNFTEEKVKSHGKIKEEPVDVVSKVEKCFFEWFSLDTFFYLYGEKKLKEMLQGKTVQIKEIINSKLSVAGYNDKIDKIIKLYGLLDNDLLTRNEIKTNLKPLPDYSILKEEGKNIEIKVRAFYQGQLEIKPAEKEEQKKEEETKSDSDPIYLPLIDAHAQNALRRKIVLDKLNRVLPELIRVFSSNYILQMNEVRNLVTTFTLAAHNIVFKPREWYLVGIIIIKLLCLKDRNLELIINSKSSESQLYVILTSYQLESNYLNDLLLRLADGTNIVAKLTDTNK